MTASRGNAVTVRFALPSEDLRPFVTTYYLMEVQTSPVEPQIEDYLHPEWFNLRFQREDWAWSAMGNEPLEKSPRFAVSGPTTKPIRVRVGPGTNASAGEQTGGTWGIGLLPLGWAQFFDAQASDYADRFVDGNADPTFCDLHPLAERLTRRFAGDEADFAAEVAAIEDSLRALLIRATPNASKITAINAALINPNISGASELAEETGMTLRSLERLSSRVFGFPPKLLLRRQRFLRSLAQFMLDPSLTWMSTMDHQYHDQAHFVRDFKRFMGMTPRAYAKLEKPMLMAAARARMEIAGEAVQGLHDPKA